MKLFLLLCCVAGASAWRLWGEPTIDAHEGTCFPVWLVGWAVGWLDSCLFVWLVGC